MTTRLFQVLFFSAGGVEIASQYVGSSLLNWLAKPLLLIFLMAHYQRNVQSVNKTFITALGFCLLGDVLLLFDENHAAFFMAGLGSFLTAHLFYILSYRQLCFSDSGDFGPSRVRLSFPIVLSSAGLVVVLYPRLGSLKWPVIAYSLTITLMVLQAVLRLGRTSNKSFWLVFVGAVSFLLSDSLLAINRFDHPLPYAGVWVMSTYIAAVYLIVQGAIIHSRLQRPK